FRVNNCWLEHPDFLRFVENHWFSNNFDGKKAFVLKEKLKSLKDGLRGWNRDVFSLVNLNIDNCVKELNEIEELWASDTGSVNQIRRQALSHDFRKQITVKESLIKLKSWLKWIKDGDSNTRFFHHSLISRRRKNQLETIKWNDRWVTEVDEVKGVIKNHFEHNFTERSFHRLVLNGIEFDKLSQADNVLLTDRFTEEEVREAIWSCDGNKSPGPDGFNFNFLKACWDIVKNDFLSFFNEFHSNAFLPKGFTASFLSLIPKKDHPQELSDYRPISLIG
ncbi:LINE-1 reverse transcriptase like, partial [Trifolium medium]|nr:LINE-1 reverse transcriptase like [Trifolium medium]